VPHREATLLVPYLSFRECDPWNIVSRVRLSRRPL
jgi:hypothetical protein